MKNPVTKVKEVVTVKIMKIGINNMAEKLDTPEEQTQLVTGTIKKGIPPSIAWAFAIFLGVVLEALQTADLSLLFSDPKSLGKMLAIAVLSKLLMRMQQPGSTVVVLDKGTK